MPKDLAKKRAYNRAYYASHKEDMKAYQKRYRLKNLDRIQERDQKYRERNREKRNVTQLAYMKTNRGRINAQKRVHYAANRQRLRAQAQAYNLAHREAKAVYNRTYRLVNKASLQAYFRTYYEAHIDQYVAKARAYSAQRAQTPINDLTTAQWREIKAHYGHRCAYCGQKFQRLTMDHILPISKGGMHTASNIVPACKSCNSRKHTGPPLVPVQPLLLTVAPARKKKGSD